MADLTVERVMPVATRAQRVRAKRLRRALLHGTLYIALSLIGVFMIMPFFWTLSTSLKQAGKEFMFPPEWIPNPFAFRNYVEVFEVAPFLLFARNTLIITAGAMAGTLITSSMVAYGFARLRFPGRDVLFVVLLSTMMLPWIVRLIPSFLIFKYLGWIDTYLPLIVPYWFGGGAFYIFLVRQFFMTIPYELGEAARIDGASSWRIWLQLMVPLSQPVMATVAVFSFIQHWNAFLLPLIYIRSLENRTISLGLQAFQGMSGDRWNLLMAASAMATFPMIALFFFAQRFFLRGIVTTGLHGR